MSGCGDPAARHGQIFPGRARNPDADDESHAPRRAAVDRRGLSRPQRLRAVERSGRGGDAHPLRPQRRGRGRRHGLGRLELLQVSGEARLRSHEAARFRFAFARRGESLACAPKRLASVGRGQGRAGAARAAGLSPDRRSAADRRAGGHYAPGRGRPAPVASGAGPRRPRGLGGARDKERFERDDVRPRHQPTRPSSRASCSSSAIASRPGCARKASPPVG